MRDGRWLTWGPLTLLGPDVHGATLGIVGFGRIGQAVARRARGFGMRVLYHDVQRLPEDVEAATGATSRRRSTSCSPSRDFVSLHVNLTAETRHLIDAARPRPDAADGRAREHVPRPGRRHRRARRALRDGTICGGRARRHRPRADAGRPPAASALDNCLVVPHIASASRATRGMMAAMAAANLLAGVRGERLPTAVNPEVHAAPA